MYSSNIVINKNGLRLEPKEKVGDIIVVVSSQPAIMIDLKKEERCTIVGLKMSHSGNSEDLEELEKLIEDKEMALNLFGGIGDGGGGAG